MVSLTPASPPRMVTIPSWWVVRTWVSGGAMGCTELGSRETVPRPAVLKEAPGTTPTRFQGGTETTSVLQFLGSRESTWGKGQWTPRGARCGFASRGSPRAAGPRAMGRGRGCGGNGPAEAPTPLSSAFQPPALGPAPQEGDPASLNKRCTGEPTRPGTGRGQLHLLSPDTPKGGGELHKLSCPWLLFVEEESILRRLQAWCTSDLLNFKVWDVSGEEGR